MLANDADGPAVESLGLAEGQSEVRPSARGSRAIRNTPAIFPLPFALCNSVPINNKHSREMSVQAPPRAAAALISLKMA